MRYAPNAVVTTMMFKSKKTSVSVINILHCFIQPPGQKVSLPKSSTLTFMLNTQQNAVLLFGSVDDKDRAKIEMMYSKTMAVNIF